MPQASEELRAEWVTDGHAERFLKERGWRLLSGWSWVKPTPQYQPNDVELRAIEYLRDEWDWGDIEVER